MEILDLSEKLAEIPVSIVIPARNEENNINRLLGLLKKEIQEGQSVEIIIANNSDPEDRTELVVARFLSKFPDLNIRLISSPRGVSNARNAGAAAANNQYMLFLDADSDFRPGFLSKAMTQLLEGKFDAAGFNFVPNTSHPVDKIIMDVTNAYQNVLKYTSTPICTAAGLFVKKSAHQQIGGFDSSMTFGEDSDYVQRMVRQGGSYGILSERLIFDMSRFSHIGRARFISLHIHNAIHYLLHGQPSPLMIEEYRKNRRGISYRQQTQ